MSCDFYMISSAIFFGAIFRNGLGTELVILQGSITIYSSFEQYCYLYKKYQNLMLVNA